MSTQVDQLVQELKTLVADILTKSNQLQAVTAQLQRECKRDTTLGDASVVYSRYTSAWMRFSATIIHCHSRAKVVDRLLETAIAQTVPTKSNAKAVMDIAKVRSPFPSTDTDLEDVFDGILE